MDDRKSEVQLNANDVYVEVNVIQNYNISGAFTVKQTSISNYVSSKIKEIQYNCNYLADYYYFLFDYPTLFFLLQDQNFNVEPL